jgi:hypothetical protein
MLLFGIDISKYRNCLQQLEEGGSAGGSFFEGDFVIDDTGANVKCE